MYHKSTNRKGSLICDQDSALISFELFMFLEISHFLPVLASPKIFADGSGFKFKYYAIDYTCAKFHAFRTKCTLISPFDYTNCCKTLKGENDGSPQKQTLHNERLETNIWESPVPRLSNVHFHLQLPEERKCDCGYCVCGREREREIHAHTHAHVHAHACTHTCTHAHAHAHAHTCTDMCMRTCTHAHMHTHVHAHMHTCAHARTHAQV